MSKLNQEMFSQNAPFIKNTWTETNRVKCHRRCCECAYSCQRWSWQMIRSFLPRHDRIGSSSSLQCCTDKLFACFLRNHPSKPNNRNQATSPLRPDICHPSTRPPSHSTSSTPEPPRAEDWVVKIINNASQMFKFMMNQKLLKTPNKLYNYANVCRCTGRISACHAPHGPVTMAISSQGDSGSALNLRQNTIVPAPSEEALLILNSACSPRNPLCRDK